MKIFLSVKANVKKEEVKKIDETHFEVRVREPGREGRANEAVLEAMAEYLGIAKSALRIARGFGSRQKVLEVLTPPQESPRGIGTHLKISFQGRDTGF